MSAVGARLRLADANRCGLWLGQGSAARSPGRWNRQNAPSLGLFTAIGLFNAIGLLAAIGLFAAIRAWPALCAGIRAAKRCAPGWIRCRWAPAGLALLVSAEAAMAIPEQRRPAPPRPPVEVYDPDPKICRAQVIRSAYERQLQPWSEQPPAVLAQLRRIQAEMTLATLRRCVRRGLMAETEALALARQLQLLPAGPAVPAGETVPSGQSAPSGQPASSQQPVPSGQSVPTGQPASSGQPLQSGQPAQSRQSDPASEMVPANKTVPVSQPVPAAPASP